MTDDGEITCPGCGECGTFTLRDDGICVAARCVNCQHEIPLRP